MSRTQSFIWLSRIQRFDISIMIQSFESFRLDSVMTLAWRRAEWSSAHDLQARGWYLAPSYKINKEFI